MTVQLTLQQRCFNNLPESLSDCQLNCHRGIPSVLSVFLVSTMTLFLHLFVLAKHHSLKYRNTGSSGVLIARVGFFQCLVICMCVSASSNLTIKHSLCSVLIYLNWTGLVWSYRWK